MSGPTKPDDAAPPADSAGDDPELDRAAIARIDILDATGASISRGTGTLVAPGLVVTALHVVAFRKSETLTPKGASIRLTFPGFTTVGAIVSDGWDAKDDWALIELAQEAPMKPMPLAALTESSREWQSYGYPDAQQADGMLVNGTVALCEGQFEGVPAHQLYCNQAASGGGGMVKGLSGAPVIIDGKLIGIMRSALMQQDRTEMGTLYACPVRAIGKKRKDIPIGVLPRINRHRLTSQIASLSRSQGWVLSAVAGSLILVAVTVLILARLRLTSVQVRGEVYTRDLRLWAGAPAALGLRTSSLGWLGVDAITVLGVDSVSYPNAPGSRASLPIDLSNSIDLTGDSAAKATTLFLDLTKPVGTDTLIVLHAGDSASRYRLEFYGNSARASIAAPIKAGASVALPVDPPRTWTLPARTGEDVSDSVMLRRPEGQPLLAELDLRARDSVTLADSVVATRIGFYGMVLSPSRAWVPAASITSGTLHVDGDNGRVVQLVDKDNFVTRGDRLIVSEIAFAADKGKIRVVFAGRARRLTLTNNGGTPQEVMPSWLDHLRFAHPIETAVVALAITAGLAFLIVAWRRGR